MSELKGVKESEEDCHSHNEASVSSCIGNSEDEWYPDQKSSTFPDGDDDWEAVADRAPDELLSPGISKISMEEKKIENPRRRGRGTFSYQKHGLYSDQQSDKLIIDNSENEAEGDAEIRELKYDTRHALVLADFPSRMRTSDLEKLLENYKDEGFAIRWVNDTTALAVFRTSSIALEACNCISIQCPFVVRVLDENDVLLRSIPQRDLEPPRQRPKTSARTAQRLIAYGMGLKLPSASFGPEKLKNQEAARKQRIVSRQNMRDDAWGDDVN